MFRWTMYFGAACAHTYRHEGFAFFVSQTANTAFALLSALSLDGGGRSSVRVRINEPTRSRGADHSLPVCI